MSGKALGSIFWRLGIMRWFWPVFWAQQGFDLCLYLYSRFTPGPKSR